MGKVVKSELYKFFKSKKNLLVILTFFIYILGFNLYNFKQYKDYMFKESTVYLSNRAKAEGIIDTKLMKFESDASLTDEEKDRLQQEIKFYNVERIQIKVMEDGYKKDKPEEYNSILIAENQRYKNIMNGLDSGIITESFLSERNMNIETMNKKIKLNQYILDNEIQPILNPYAMNGVNTLVMFLEGNNLLVLIFLITLLSADMYLSEVEEGSYKISFTQPFERKYIYFGKIIIIVGISLLLIFLGSILNFIINSAIFGIGDMNYPIITSDSIKKLSLGEKNGELLLIPTWQYILMGYGELLPILFFTIGLIMFVSIYFDSNSKTLGVSVMLLLLAFVFTNLFSKESILNLVYPYSYLFTRNIIEAKVRSNFFFGILLNSSLSIVLLILSYYKFVNKDFLGAKE